MLTIELLVRLSLDAGAAVRAEAIIEELWADDALRTEKNIGRGRRAEQTQELIAVITEEHPL